MRSQGIKGPSYKFIHGNSKEIINMRTSVCLPCCVDDLLHQWPNLVFGKFQRKAWSMLSCCVNWSIWLMRNKVIFNDGTATFKDIFSLILYRLSNWLKSADKFFMATDTSLIMGPEGMNFLFWQGPQALLVVTEPERDLEALGSITSWDGFTQSLLTRFGPFILDDPIKTLTRLRQTTIVEAYKSQFEILSNQLKRLAEPYKLSCFLSGLQEDIRFMVRLLNPSNLTMAFGMVKMQEKNAAAFRRSSRLGSTSPRPFPNSPASDMKALVPIQCLSPVQMKERRVRGLCYNCDERWGSGHKCKSAHLFIMECEDSEGEELQPIQQPQLLEETDSLSGGNEGKSSQWGQFVQYREMCGYSIPHAGHVLHGITPTEVSLMNGEQFGKAMNQDKWGLVLQLLPPNALCISTLETEPFFVNLLDQFKEVFGKPTGLPPNYDHNHNIVLQPGAKPICDDSWRVCVDYRALNKDTIKAKFRIPIMDEFLDELHRATIFSVVLMQQERPIAFMSQVIHGKALHFSTYEKELMALVLAVKKWHSYVLGQTFRVQTNHQSFKYLLEQKAGIKNFIKECDICQHNKNETIHPAGLLQPLPIPTKVWVDLSLDFIEGLPLSNGLDVILVVVDRLRNDRDPMFISLFWKELFKLQGIELKFSSAYHPQTDGQTEIVNKCVEQYLRCFSRDKPKEWSRWLPLA
ncbi:hypothetical protein NC652_037308 [Populus alba x Populus x berolinensis]|nr:hypothetical protein NC652_037308 [Populus alba x Populus x berolinensis]